MDDDDVDDDYDCDDGDGDDDAHLLRLLNATRPLGVVEVCQPHLLPSLQLNFANKFICLSIILDTKLNRFFVQYFCVWPHLCITHCELALNIAGSALPVD